jgi:hypothetical protein
MNENQSATPLAAPHSPGGPEQALNGSHPRRRESRLSPDARLAQGVRAGEPEASHWFVGEYYPVIFHYLLYLTGRRDVAEDLTQETFLQAWRRL